jgi:hypothetical protein
MRRQKPRLRVAPILALATAAFLADTVIAEGRVRQDLTDQTWPTPTRWSGINVSG